MHILIGLIVVPWLVLLGFFCLRALLRAAVSVLLIAPFGLALLAWICWLSGTSLWL